MTVVIRWVDVKTVFGAQFPELVSYNTFQNPHESSCIDLMVTAGVGKHKELRQINVSFAY